MIGKRQMNKIVIISLFMLIIFLIMKVNCFASESGIRLEADDANLEIGVSTNISLIIDNLKDASLEKIEGIDNFDVLSSVQSSSTSIINGKKSQSVIINMSILPKVTGDLKLTAYVKNDDQSLITNTVTIHVTEKKENQEGENNNQDIYVKTNISKESTYFGEKIVLTYDLYTCKNLDNYGVVDLNLDGFVIKEVPQMQLKDKVVNIDGKNYVKAELRKIILTPVSTGEIKIPSCRVQVNLQGEDYFSSGKTIFLYTDEKTINVKQLPEDNCPKNFSGLVGKPKISTEFSQDEINYGESFTLQINLSGNCNIDTLESIYPKDKDDVTIYETSKDLKEGIDGTNYYAEKSYEVIVIPQETGKIELEPVAVNYFDVEKGTYEELIIDGKTLTVNGEKTVEEEKQDESKQNSSSNDKQSIIINQIQPLQTDGDYFTIKKSYVYVLLIIAALLIIFYFIYFKIKKSDIRGNKQLRNLYNKAKKATDNKERFKYLNDMIKYRYNVSLKTASKSELKNYISEKSVLKDVLSVINIMEKNYQLCQIEEVSIADLISKIYKQM